MSGRARARGRALAHNQVAAKQYNEMIYLPPNGVNVHYAKTKRFHDRWRHGLAHPRTYITHQEYRLLLSKLIFCEWTDERNVTRYYGFEEKDAYDIIENRDTKDMQAGDPVLIVPLSQSRDHKGGFYDKLSDARKRFLLARASHSNREKSGDTMAAFLVFFASVARHDDPVAAETLSPIECIARAALVEHEHDEEKRRKAMELLAQQKAYSVQDEMTAWFVDIVCDVVTFGGVFSYEAYRLVDYVVFLLARATGTGIGRMLSACLGDNAYMCLAIVILDLLVAVGTVLAPFMLGFSGAAIAVAVSSATGEAKARCKSNALDLLLGSLSNQMIRIVSTLLQKVAFSKDVDEIVAAATRMLELKNIWNLGTSIVLSELFSQLDGLVKREINKRLNSLSGRLFACFARLAVHYAISQLVETMLSPELGGMYRRMLVPKWMNIAVMGAESAKASQENALIEEAKLSNRRAKITADNLNKAKKTSNLAGWRAAVAAEINLEDSKRSHDAAAADAYQKKADTASARTLYEDSYRIAMEEPTNDFTLKKRTLDMYTRTFKSKDRIAQRLEYDATKGSAYPDAWRDAVSARGDADIAKSNMDRSAIEKTEAESRLSDAMFEVQRKMNDMNTKIEAERAADWRVAMARSKAERPTLNAAHAKSSATAELANLEAATLAASAAGWKQGTTRLRVETTIEPKRNAQLQNKLEAMKRQEQDAIDYNAADSAGKTARRSATETRNHAKNAKELLSKTAASKSTWASATDIEIEKLKTQATRLDKQASVMEEAAQTAEAAAAAAKQKVDASKPGFISKLVRWWAGGKTQMGMAHFV